MARINTYFKDKSLTNDDLLLGSSYEGMGSNGPIYKTRSYRLVDLAKYMNLVFTVDEVNYNLHDLTNNLTAVEVGLGNLETTLTTKIDTDIALLQTQTTESITLLDDTLSTSISDLADTVTAEVTDLNAKILSGDTALSADIVALNDTLVAETAALTLLIDQETTTLADTINTLDTTIADQLIQVNTDIANALQTAIDSGELATIAQANIDSEIIAREDADGAIAARVDTIDTQFEFSTEDGSIIGAAGALNQTINTAASTAAGAVATRVDVLETEYELSTEDGSILGLAQNSVTNVALTTLYGSAATRIDEIETQFSITDGTITGFSTAAQTRIDTSISNATSAQFQTLDTIKTQFIFTDGAITAVSDVIQTSITDSISDATSAQFLKLDEVATQFVFDGNAISGVQGSISSTINSAKLEAISTADTAAQSKIDTFAAKIVTTDAEGNITGLSDAVQTSVSDVIAQDGYAESSRVDTLETTVGLIPLIFKQNDAPPLDSPIGSLWFDTDDNNKRYILNVGTPANTWDALEDGEFQSFKSSATEDINTNATNVSAAATKINNLNAVLEILDQNGNLAVATKADYFDEITTYVDANSATSSKVQTLEATVGDENGGLVSSVTTNQQAIATVDGKLTASYGLQVDAGGNIASMRLFADENSSEIRFNADAFKIWNGTAAEAPFEVSGGVVKIKSANIGSVSFGSLTEVPDTFITTVIYADDINGTNPSTTKGTKNFVAFYNSAAAWVDGDALPAGLTFSQIRGDDGATGPQGPTGPAGADGTNGIDGADGYTPIKNVDYFDGLDGTNGVDGTDGAPGVDGDSANVVVTNATAAQCPNGGKVYEFYVGTTLIDTQVVCNGADGAEGPAGAAGEAGVRIATGILFYQLGSDTAPTTPSSTGITYNFDNGTFSSYPTDWGEGTPEMEAGTASNKYWTSRYQVIESSSGSGSGTPSFFTPIRSFAFNQVVTFDSLGSSGTTVIDGSRITTGFIRSGNWDAPDAGETFADAGTALYLNTGAIISKGFVIDDNGNAFFKGDITGASGTFSGSITGASGTFGGVTLGNSGLSSSQFSIDTNGNASFGGALDVGTVVIDDGYVKMQSNSATLEGTIQFIDASDVYSGSIYASNTANQRGISMYSADKSRIAATNGASVDLYGDTYTIDPGHVRIYSTNGTVIEGGPLTVIDLNIVGSTKAATGFTKLANGLILQWGYTNGTVTNQLVYFPIAFPTACTSVSVTPDLTGGTSSGWGYANAVSTSSFRAVTQTPYDFWWMAIGY